ncbi:unnamed protein product [Sympodiomycopsis kandeliae]
MIEPNIQRGNRRPSMRADWLQCSTELLPWKLASTLQSGTAKIGGGKTIYPWASSRLVPLVLFMPHVRFGSAPLIDIVDVQVQDLGRWSFVRLESDGIEAFQLIIQATTYQIPTMPASQVHNAQVSHSFTLRKYYQGRPSDDGSFHWRQFTEPTLICTLTEHTGTESNGLSAMYLAIEWKVGPNSDTNFSQSQGINNSNSPPSSQRAALLSNGDYGRMPLASAVRRFQINFMSEEDVNEFAQLVQTVCPWPSSQSSSKSGGTVTSQSDNAALNRGRAVSPMYAPFETHSPMPSPRGRFMQPATSPPPSAQAKETSWLKRAPMPASAQPFAPLNMNTLAARGGILGRQQSPEPLSPLARAMSPALMLAHQEEPPSPALDEHLCDSANQTTAPLEAGSIPNVKEKSKGRPKAAKATTKRKRGKAAAADKENSQPTAAKRPYKRNAAPASVQVAVEDEQGGAVIPPTYEPTIVPKIERSEHDLACLRSPVMAPQPTYPSWAGTQSAPIVVDDWHAGRPGTLQGHSPSHTWPPLEPHQPVTPWHHPVLHPYNLTTPFLHYNWHPHMMHSAFYPPVADHQSRHFQTAPMHMPPGMPPHHAMSFAAGGYGHPMSPYGPMAMTTPPNLRSTTPNDQGTLIHRSLDGLLRQDRENLLETSQQIIASPLFARLVSEINVQMTYESC